MEAIATLNLLPRKHFEITLSDKTVISGQFSTWALKRFCDKKNILLSEAQPKLQDLSGFTDYLLCAVEGVSRLSGQPFIYTDVQACLWIDELGGANSLLFASLIAWTADEDTTEKKTETTS